MGDPFLRLEAVGAWWQLRRNYNGTEPVGYVLVVKASNGSSSEFRGSKLQQLISRGVKWAEQEVEIQW